MVIICEVIKGIGEIIIIEGVDIGIEVTIGIGVDHLEGRVQIGELVQA